MRRILLRWRGKHGLTTLLLPVLFSFAVSANAWSQQPQEGFYGSHMGWHGIFFSPILMIVFTGVVIAVVVLLIKWLGSSTPGINPSNPPPQSPLDLLKERFARGEIDKDEYEERRRVLRE